MNTTLRLEPDNTEEMFYSGNSAENRCVGHLRVYFEDDMMFHTFFPHNGYTHDGLDEFKTEFNHIIDTLRKNLLKSIESMRKFIAKYPNRELAWNTFGYKIETMKYEYYIRCYKGTGDYSYIYCYKKDGVEL